MTWPGATTVRGKWQVSAWASPVARHAGVKGGLEDSDGGGFLSGTVGVGVPAVDAEAGLDAPAGFEFGEDVGDAVAEVGLALSVEAAPAAEQVDHVVGFVEAGGFDAFGADPAGGFEGGPVGGGGVVVRGWVEA